MVKAPKLVELSDEELMAETSDVYTVTCTALEQLHQRRLLTGSGLTCGLVLVIYMVLKPYHTPQEIADLIDGVSKLQLQFQKDTQNQT